MQTLKIVTTVGLFAVSNVTQANIFNDINRALNTVNQAVNTVNNFPDMTGANNHTITQNSQNYGHQTQYSRLPLAQITDYQKQMIAKNVVANTQDSNLSAVITEASSSLSYFLEVASCQNEEGKLLAGQVLTSANVSPALAPNAIIPKMKYHPLDSCLTVQSVSGWSVPVRNKLQVNVAFVSELSGELAKRQVFLLKENGVWKVEGYMVQY